MKKLLFWFFLVFGLFISISFAKDYLFFYWNGCPHCGKVEKFLKDNNIENDFSFEKKEIYFNRSNLNEFNEYIEKLELPSNQVGVPMLIVNKKSDSCKHLAWDKAIIDFFQKKLDEIQTGWCEDESCDPIYCDKQDCNHENCVKQWEIVLSSTIKPAIENNDIVWEVLLENINEELLDNNVIEENVFTEELVLWKNSSDKKDTLAKRLKFLVVMMPAALADSINPCAFAVMLLLLSTILSRHKNRKKTILAWLLFSLAVFLSYFAMWLWLFSALSTMTNTYILKIIVWTLGILVWLANLKDFFWYGKVFVMEVPRAWRPKMQSIINSVSSPWWAFFVWFLVSVFLLPCSSWPYFTILWYLSAESNELHTRWYIYLLIYNLIFVLPMAIIVILVAFGYSTVDKLAKIKHTNTRLIHLIVWLLMLGLWTYVLVTM